MYSGETRTLFNREVEINFVVTTYDMVPIEGCKVKKCGVHLLCPEDYKWKDLIDLSSLKRKLKLNGNGRYNDEPPSDDFSAACNCQFKSSATSLDLNEMLDTTEPLSKRLKVCNYKNKEIEVAELNPSTSQPTGFADSDSEIEVAELNPNLVHEFPSSVLQRFSLAAAEIDGVLYATGGFDGKDYLKMAAGRKIQTFIITGNSPSTNPTYTRASARNLGKSQLGGVIFGCKNNTIKECLTNQLFGLPAQDFTHVKNIDTGLFLFLFNYTDGNFTASMKLRALEK
ncbi:hypothetical protein Pint_34969 [Pistacia integerrima]|uniref:Uncharacterized protein n=1 Tax=Pistacia integerrima TaxID=434235 RepID=A0ACC0Y2F4_9ROSI|nr:hypothetical protein Pint_34969 [Pistacia integerrima]